jgi:hypothetical protein
VPESPDEAAARAASAADLELVEISSLGGPVATTEHVAYVHEVGQAAWLEHAQRRLWSVRTRLLIALGLVWLALQVVVLTVAIWGPGLNSAARLSDLAIDPLLPLLGAAVAFFFTERELERRQ